MATWERASWERERRHTTPTSRHPSTFFTRHQSPYIAPVQPTASKTSLDYDSAARFQSPARPSSHESERYHPLSTPRGFRPEVERYRNTIADAAAAPYALSRVIDRRPMSPVPPVPRTSDSSGTRDRMLPPAVSSRVHHHAVSNTSPAPSSIRPPEPSESPTRSKDIEELRNQLTTLTHTFEDHKEQSVKKEKALQRENGEMNQRVQELEKCIKTMHSREKDKEKDYTKRLHEADCAASSRSCKLESTINELNRMLHHRESQLDELKAKVQGMEEREKALLREAHMNQSSLADKDRRIAELERDQGREELRVELSKKTGEVKEKASIIDRLSTEAQRNAAKYDADLLAKDQAISQLREDMQAQLTAMAHLRTTLADRDERERERKREVEALEQALEECKGRVVVLGEEVATQKEQLEGRDNRIHALTSGFKELREAREDLQRELDKRETEVQGHIRDNELLRTKVESLHNKMQALTKALHDRYAVRGEAPNGVFEALEHAVWEGPAKGCDEGREALAEERHRSDELAKQLDRLESDVRQSTVEKEGELGSLSARCDELKKMLDDAYLAREAAFERQREEEEARKRVECEVVALRETYAELAKRAAQHDETDAARAEELSKVASERENAQREISHLKEAIARHEQRTAELERSLREAHEQLAESQQMRNEMALAGEQRDEESRRGAQELKRLEEEMRNVQQTAAELSQQLDVERSERMELAALLEDERTAKAHAMEAVEATRRGREELDMHISQMAGQAEADREALSRQVLAERAEKEEVLAELQRERADRDEMQRRLDSLLRAEEERSARTTDIERRNAELAEQIESLEALVEKERRERKALEESIAGGADEVHRLAADREELLRELEGERGKVAALLTERDGLERSGGEERSRVAAQLREAEEALRHEREKNAELHGVLEQERAKNAELHGVMEQERVRSAGLFADLEQERAALHERLVNSTAADNTLTGEVAHLRQQVEHLHREIAERDRIIAECEREVAEQKQATQRSMSSMSSSSANEDMRQALHEERARYADLLRAYDEERSRGDKLQADLAQRTASERLEELLAAERAAKDELVAMLESERAASVQLRASLDQEVARSAEVAGMVEREREAYAEQHAALQHEREMRMRLEEEAARYRETADHAKATLESTQRSTTSSSSSSHDNQYREITAALAAEREYTKQLLAALETEQERVRRLETDLRSRETVPHGHEISANTAEVRPSLDASHSAVSISSSSSSSAVPPGQSAEAAAQIATLEAREAELRERLEAEQRYGDELTKKYEAEAEGCRRLQDELRDRDNTIESLQAHLVDQGHAVEELKMALKKSGGDSGLVERLQELLADEREKVALLHEKLADVETPNDTTDDEQVRRRLAAEGKLELCQQQAKAELSELQAMVADLEYELQVKEEEVFALQRLLEIESEKVQYLQEQQAMELSRIEPATDAPSAREAPAMEDDDLADSLSESRQVLRQFVERTAMLEMKLVEAERKEAALVQELAVVKERLRDVEEERTEAQSATVLFAQRVASYERAFATPIDEPMNGMHSTNNSFCSLESSDDALHTMDGLALLRIEKPSGDMLELLEASAENTNNPPHLPQSQLPPSSRPGLEILRASSPSPRRSLDMLAGEPTKLNGM